MQDTRCECGKIVCQKDEEKIVIQCRHCKRKLVISTKGWEANAPGLITKIILSPETTESRGQQF
ncbi:MAG: hypothetical protein ACYCX4_05960 [Bacillota bacterium]